MGAERQDGGPAFPRAGLYNDGDNAPGAYDSEPQEGLSARDYFAAKAMQAIASREDSTPGSKEAVPEFNRQIAVGSYRMADAMLAAREVQP